MGKEPARKYFRCSVDDSGPKFFCNHEGFHYTLRLAGKPMLILEHFYVEAGGQREDFQTVYELAKEHKPLTGYPGALDQLKQAIVDSNKTVSALKDIALTGKSPFVMYISEYDDSKVPRHLEADERV